MVRAFNVAIASLFFIGWVLAQTGTPTALSPSASSAAASASAAAATASTSSETSNVQGAAFSRYICIFLENTDYAKVAGNADFAFLAQQGIVLTNYYALTHPSEPVIVRFQRFDMVELRRCCGRRLFRNWRQ
jgi:hypothetical protein